MERFIVSMKHYDDFSGKVTDSITANDFETAKRVFEKWVEQDKREWNTELLGNDLKFKQTEKTYNAKCFTNFGLEYTTITIRKK